MPKSTFAEAERTKAEARFIDNRIIKGGYAAGSKAAAGFRGFELVSELVSEFGQSSIIEGELDFQRCQGLDFLV